MTVTERERRRMELVDGGANRTDLCEQLAMREYELDNLKAKNKKLRDLCEWLLNPYRLGAVTGEGVERQWCRETYDGGSYRLRDLTKEVGA